MERKMCSSKWIFFAVALRPNAGHGLLILEVSRSHSTTHHTRQDSSGRVISSSQRPLPDYTQHSQQTSMPPVGFEPTISAGERPQIARPLGPAVNGFKAGDFPWQSSSDTESWCKEYATLSLVWRGNHTLPIEFSSSLPPWSVKLLKTKHRLIYLTLRLLMSYIHGAPILDVSRSHTTTQHSR